MDIDDPSSYATERLDGLERVDRALELFAGDDKRPFAFGDTDMAQAWLLDAGAYDELARASAWVEADRAAAVDPNSTELASVRDKAAESALHRDRPDTETSTLLTLLPDELVAHLPHLVNLIRHGRFPAIAIGRRRIPEAVLVSQDEHRELIQALMRWHQSPPFLASLDPAVHKPMAKSRPVDLDEYFRSLGPKSAAIWEEVSNEDDRADPESR